MAFKMKGFNPGQGTGMGSAFLKTNQSERAAARLAKKEERLTSKLEGASEKKKARLENRISNVQDKKARKEKMAENIAADKNKRANTSKDVTRDIGVGTITTKKKTNEAGRKVEVERTLKNNKGEVVRGTEKTKSGEGLNKTIDKTITKKDGTKVTKKGEPSFGDAFKQARSGGAKTFEWKGKKYHTRTKEEDKGYVDKSKGEAGPQTKAAQKYDNTRFTPLKKKKKY